jgi:hypothetical protein
VYVYVGSPSQVRRKVRDSTYALRMSKNIRFEFETIFECRKIRKTLNFSNFESNIFSNPTPREKALQATDLSLETLSLSLSTLERGEREAHRELNLRTINSRVSIAYSILHYYYLLCSTSTPLYAAR